MKQKPKFIREVSAPLFLICNIQYLVTYNWNIECHYYQRFPSCKCSRNFVVIINSARPVDIFSENLCRCQMGV